MKAVLWYLIQHQAQNYLIGIKEPNYVESGQQWSTPEVWWACASHMLLEIHEFHQLHYWNGIILTHILYQHYWDKVKANKCSKIQFTKLSQNL